MSGISDAAAISWVVKSNMASSACMTNQMKMYRKGVSDGKDKDTIIDEDWDLGGVNMSIDVDDSGGVPNGGLGPGFTDLRKGVFWKIIRNKPPYDLPDYWVRFWISPTPVTEYNHNYHPYYRETGRLHLTEYENGVQKYDNIATYTYNYQPTGVFSEWCIGDPYPGYAKLMAVRSKEIVNNVGTTAEYHMIHIDYDYHWINRNGSTGEITNEAVVSSGTTAFPGTGLSSNAFYGVSNISCTSEVPDFLQTT